MSIVNIFDIQAQHSAGKVFLNQKNISEISQSALFCIFFLQKKCLEETLQKRSNYGMDCTHYNNAKWKLSVAWENMMSCCFLLELNRCHGYCRVAWFFHLVDRFAVWSGWPWSDLRCELSAGIVGPLPTSANSEGCPTNCWGPPVRHLVVA